MKAAPSLFGGGIGGFLSGRLALLRQRRPQAIACLASLAASVAVSIAFSNIEAEGRLAHGDFEVGRVADRDVIADYTLSFVDEEATRARLEAQRSLVPAVFRYLPRAAGEALAAWEEFSDFADALEEGGAGLATMQLAVQAEFPGLFSQQAVAAYFLAPDRADFRRHGRDALAMAMAGRIFSLDGADLGGFNPDVAELLALRGDRTERERVERQGMKLIGDAGAAVQRAAEALAAPASFARLAPSLLAPFVRENAAFSREDTELRVAEALARVPPVVRTIEQGQSVIRAGFVVSWEDMQDLYALRAALPLQAPRNHAGVVLLLCLLYLLFILLQGRPVLGRELPAAQSCLLFALAFLYIAGSGLARSLLGGAMPAALFFPTALLVMIPAVLMGHRAAFALALAFPLCAAALGFFDIPSYAFALVSGLSASVFLRKAEKRMDLIKAGMKIAGANCLAAVLALLMGAADFAGYPAVIFWAALNGMVSGMLVLGLLPPLEHFLNAATTFRLIELSDLNAPILRKLFTAAPGTYSHSVMVATLAEQACQDIGANALLARVGAYYHDIGKMDNPDYFVENQTGYNRHDGIAPRLSATVIRSHLKIGVEKARQLGLPEEVVDIVGEHHGNSLIVWFYRKAEEQEGQVNAEDFAYPGSPPRSREAAVVMLADATEAAIRTLEKPTATKMEKFIQQIIDGKVGAGQLALSELTFRDLEAIKNAFVRVLAGYYHSRIEYPKAGLALPGAEGAEGGD